VIVISMFGWGTQGARPSYLLLSVLAVGGFALICGFSASYVYYWEMFGNSIVTETYSKLYGPAPNDLKK
jgi:hypothetical protein